MEDKNSKDKKLSKAIMHALEVKQAFELFSYRIIEPEDFIKRIEETSEFILHEIKGPKYDRVD